jgi:hypothetical protein
MELIIINTYIYTRMLSTYLLKASRLLKVNTSFQHSIIKIVNTQLPGSQFLIKH